jgi:hypothetical protein
MASRELQILAALYPTRRRLDQASLGSVLLPRVFGGGRGSSGEARKRKSSGIERIRQVWAKLGKILKLQAVIGFPAKERCRGANCLRVLLGHCVSLGVNALNENGDRYRGPGLSVHGVQQRLAQADRLPRAVGLDMVAGGWRPTVDNCLSRVTSPAFSKRTAAYATVAGWCGDQFDLRSVLKPAQSSSEKSFGCSQAAKWPPCATLL